METEINEKEFKNSVRTIPVLRYFSVKNDDKMNGKDRVHKYTADREPSIVLSLIFEKLLNLNTINNL